MIIDRNCLCVQFKIVPNALERCTIAKRELLKDVKLSPKTLFDRKRPTEIEEKTRTNKTNSEMHLKKMQHGLTTFSRKSSKIKTIKIPV